MIQHTVRIRNRAGLHTRPAAGLVKLVTPFNCEFTIERDGFRINGRSIIGVMTLAAEQGAELLLEFDGPDAAAAAEVIVAYIERGFDEEV